MIRSSKSNRRGLSRFFTTFFLIATVVLAGVCAVVFFEGEKPQINVKDIPDFINKSSTIGFSVTDAQSGLRSVKVVLRQDAKEATLFSDTYQRAGYTGKIGPAEESRTILLEPEKLGFKDGPAEIEIEAHDFSLRGPLTGNVSILKKNITIDTHPPKINLLYSERYLKQGGAGIVIYRLSKDAVTNGAQINSHFFAGFPANSGKGDVNIAYIALPYNAEQIDVAQIIAKDEAGNQAVVPFAVTLEKSAQKNDQINISDGFLQAKIPEFEQHYPEMKGDLKDKYLYANNTIRQENNKKIFAVCQHPNPEQLWQGRFLRMPGSARAGFADHRTYLYKGEPIDHQVHLGIDLAQVARTEVKAANAGKVIFTDYLGIYGNTIILDHGQGIFSLYAHLSQFDVKPGEMVKKDEVIARTGHTGMAGGDHLHFSMLIDGIFVTPFEWWDQHWIDMTINTPLQEINVK